MKKRFFRCSLLAMLASPCASAATIVELGAEASRAALNDLAGQRCSQRQQVLPRRKPHAKNAMMVEAMALAKSTTRIKVQSGGTQTYPVYAKGGKIESWRIRSDLVLESADTALRSELVGKLQGNLVSPASPSCRPRKPVGGRERRHLDAIAAFRARAKLVAEAFGKPYRIKQMNIGQQSYRPPAPMMRAAPAAAMDMAPMPMEAGESQSRSRSMDRSKSPTEGPQNRR